MVPTAPAVIVHGLADAHAACAPGRRLVLLSAPGAAGYTGSAWWRALVAAARAEAPGLIAGDILDCGAAAGYALEALRLGQRVLVLARSCPARAAVVSAAAGLGAAVLDRAPPALDMADPDARHRLAAWLSRE